ncbi:hypothetical protein VP236O401_P0006 [Vibrio phage 236O40-1]|nr:hypothetical protein VP236O401_P0006 [Vibrio phage 236O40-1]
MKNLNESEKWAEARAAWREYHSLGKITIQDFNRIVADLVGTPRGKYPRAI